jgi:hypothetical protein
MELACVLGLGTGKHPEAGLLTQGVFWRTRDNKLEGENFQEVYLLHFLAKPGAEKAQLGVFGCSGAIGAIYLEF